MDLKSLSEIPVWDWPDDARHVIIKTLADEGAPEDDRLLAADMAGDLGEFSDKDAATIVNVISSQHQPEAVRGSAAIALGPVLEEVDMEGFDEESGISEAAFKKVRQAFKRLFEDDQVPKFVRRRILESSVRCPETWHADAVRSAYADADPDWRLTAVFCMQYIRGFDAEILQSLASTDPEIRYHAIGAAGNWELKQAWPFVLELLEKPCSDKDELIAAIEAAGSINPVEAADLIGRYADSEDEEIAEAAMDALSMMEGFTENENWDTDEEDDEE